MNSSKRNQRRTLLKAAAAAMIAPRLAFASTPTNPDVVIIGAGIAGIEAAKTLQANGISFVLVEASNRIGGRAYTDHETFGVPFDTHAHWMMHSADNPVIWHGRNNGFDIYRDPDNSRYFVGNREATAAEYNDVYRTFSLFQQKITASAVKNAGNDDNAYTALGKDFFELPWGYTVASDFSVWGMAQNSLDYSPRDFVASAGGDSHFCRQGFGSVVAHYGRDVPVSLATWVSEIDWSGNGVRVKTSAGTIQAKAAILTVSVGVLANNRIRFTPELPLKKQEAIDGIAMGVMNYIGLQFTEDVFGFGTDVYVTQQQPDENGVQYKANMAGTSLVYAYVGGNQARALEREPIETSVAYSLDGMKSMLGNDIEKTFIKGHATTTGVIPFWDGAYSTAKPGKQPMRAVLRQTVANKLFFSGEACHPTQWATLHGGLNAGKTSAKHATWYVKSLN